MSPPSRSWRRTVGEVRPPGPRQPLELPAPTASPVFQATAEWNPAVTDESVRLRAIVEVCEETLERLMCEQLSACRVRRGREAAP